MGLPGSSFHSQDREQALLLPCSWGSRDTAELGSKITCFQWQKRNNDSVVGTPVVPSHVSAQQHLGIRELGLPPHSSVPSGCGWQLLPWGFPQQLITIMGPPPCAECRASICYGGETRTHEMDFPSPAHRADGLKCIPSNISALCPLMQHVFLGFRFALLRSMYQKLP